MLRKLFKSLVVLVMGLGGLATIAFFSVIGGTFVYWLWPVAIPATFPGLVETGVLTGQLMWWPAVCLTWLCGILIKSTQTVNNKPNKQPKSKNIGTHFDGYQRDISK